MDPKAIHKIYFNGNLDRALGAAIFFIIEEAKETILDCSQGTVNGIIKGILNVVHNFIFHSFNLKLSTYNNLIN